jgi:hypothetical protein
MVNNQHTVKKCPNCGKYSAWDNSLEAICEFCGAVLDPRTLLEVQVKEEKKRQAQLRFEHPVFWVSIKPTDKPLVVFGKEILRGAQIVYMAIVSFLLWITAIIAG